MTEPPERRQPRRRSGGAGQTELRPLRRANAEPGERAIFVVVSILHALVAPLTRRDWRNQDRIPQTGGVVLVANHISNFDPIALGQYLAFSGRWPRFLAKASLFSVPVLGTILRACGQIPVQRNTRSAADALAHAIRAVGEGKAVVVYPEGTITTDPDLWPMAGKTGAARIAYATGCPIIPIGQWGAQELMYGKKIEFPRLWPRKTLRLMAGDPIRLEDVGEGPVTSAALIRTTEQIMAALTALVGELRGEAPPDRRPGAPPAVDPSGAGS